MTDNNQGGDVVPLPSGFRQALTAIIQKELSTLVTAVNDLEIAAKESGAYELAQFKTAFDKCQLELMALKNKFVDMESGVSVYQELAERRQKEIKQLQDVVAKLSAEVALLLSALENKDNDNE